MKVLFVGYTTTWDAMAAALGYLGKNHIEGTGYGDYRSERAGRALAAGIDEQGREIYALGSARPVLVKKVVGELIKVGYPWADEVEVIALDLPGQPMLKRLVRMTNWPFLGGLMHRLTFIWAGGRYPIWWEEGRKIRLRLNQG